MEAGYYGNSPGDTGLGWIQSSGSGRAGARLVFRKSRLHPARDQEYANQEGHTPIEGSQISIYAAHRIGYLSLLYY